MKSPQTLLITAMFLLVAITPSVRADGTHPRGVKLDGSIGSSGKLDLPGPDYEIRAEYGQQTGANLFHSFQKFNIHADESASFSGPDSVKNVISRVTGGDASWIDGALSSTIPEADLYMLNPAGVMFGPNASLDLNGSFHISTADYLKLGENERFLAEPLESEVLSFSAPSAFGFLDNTPGDISLDETFLKVPGKETLSIIGGDIRMHNSTLYAREGQINLAGTGSAGEVRLNENAIETEGFERLGRIDISRDRDFLAPDGGEFLADLEVSGMGDDRVSGSVHIRGEQFHLSGGRVDSWNYGLEPGGDISIRVTDTVTIDAAGIEDGGSIANAALDDGGSGRIEIEARQLTLKNGAKISGSTWGLGNGGDITIRASDGMRLSGVDESDFSGGIFASSYSEEAEGGNAGNIGIETGQAILSGDAVIASNTFGAGQGGHISIRADEALSISQGGILSESYSEEASGGDGGNIDIDAPAITLTDQAEISGTTFGGGQGGAITIRTETMTLSDGSVFNNALGTLPGSGNAGNIEIEAQEIAMKNGAQINSFSEGPGNGGDIVIHAENAFTASGKDASGYSSGVWASSGSISPDAGDAGTVDIRTRQLKLSQGSSISGSTHGPGKGGSILIIAKEAVTLSDARILSNSYSMETDAGDAGNIEISGGQISLKDRAKISGTTFGLGKGGTIVIRAETLSLSDGSVFNNTLGTASGSGNAGNVEIEAGQITMTQGGQINSFSEGTGNGGHIVIRAENALTASGQDASGYSSGIWASSGSPSSDAGNAGNVDIRAGQLNLTQGATVSGSTHGPGKGGRILIRANGALMLSDGHILSNSYGQASDAGDSGNIEITAGQLFVKNSARISGLTEGAGQGGDIHIRTDGEVSMSDGRIEATSQGQGPDVGDAGNIDLQAGNISLSNGAQIVAGTLGGGQGGAIVLRLEGKLALSGKNEAGKISAILGSSVGTGDAGSIEIEAEDITLTDDAQISSITRGPGKGGDILIRTEGTIMLSKSIISGSSDDRADTDEGDAGDIEIHAREIILTQGGQISGGTRGSGRGGRILLHVEKQLKASGTQENSNIASGVIGASYGKDADSGDAGDIEISAGAIDLTDGAQIFSGTFGSGDGGTISISAAGAMNASGMNATGRNPSGVIANTLSHGDAGNIDIEAGQLSLTDGAQILDSTSGTGNGGSVRIRVADTLAISETNTDGDLPSGVLGTSYSTEDNSGNAGDTEISARQIILTQGGMIYSGTQGSGNGGTMTIRAEDSVTISGANKTNTIVSGVYGSSESTDADSGRGASIVISAPTLILSDEGRISTSGWGGGAAGDIALEITCLSLANNASLSSESRSPENGGAAGTIVIAKEISISRNDDGSIRIEPAEPANSVRLSNHSVVSTDSESSGGGKIIIYAKDMLHLSDSRISTSVSQGSDKGGDVSIGSNATQIGPRFVILNGSHVQANADEGDGGAIFIITGNYMKSSDSVTEATSRRGNEGSVEVAAPDTDILSSLTVLPADFPDAGKWMEAECEGRSGEKVSRFVITGRDALPTAHDDCQASPLPGMERDTEKGN